MTEEDTFIFHRPPLQHQREIFDRRKNKRYFALFMEQRTGKTKVILDIFARHVLHGVLDTLIVIAYPAGVHRVWIDELPKDLSPEFLSSARSLAWRPSRMKTKTAKAELVALLNHDGPIIFTINCEAIKRADQAWDFLTRLIMRRRCMVVADESSWAANYTGQTERLLTLGGFYSEKPNVIVKAILDGTPVDEGPHEIFYPTQFLKKGLLGFTSMSAFKSRYFEYEMEDVERAPGVVETVRKKFRTYGGREYEKHIGYRNLEELQDKIKVFSERVLRRDISDAPPKIYQTRYFTLTTKQRQVYDRLRDEYVAELSRGDIDVPLVITRMLRLQMVARNYYPPERVGVMCPACNGITTAPDTADNAECPRCEGLGIVVELTGLSRIDSAHNPAAAALGAELVATRGPVVIWARFRQDVADCVDVARDLGRTIGRYDGTVPESEREATYQAFRAGKINTIAATVGSGLTRGRDLTRADALIYYSNDFSRRKRSQSEDRAEALARTRSTDIIDLVAEDTRDLDVIEALRRKQDVASMITNDGPSRWL